MNNRGQRERVRGNLRQYLTMTQERIEKGNTLMRMAVARSTHGKGKGKNP